MIKFNSIKFKISVLYVVLLGLILLSYNLFLYASLRHTLYEDLDEHLMRKDQELSDLINNYASVLPEGPGRLEAAAKRVLYAGESDIAGMVPEALELKLLKVIDKYDLLEDYIVVSGQRGPIAQTSMPPGVAKHFLRLAKSLPDSGETMRFDTLNTPEVSLRVITARYALGSGESYLLQTGTRLRHISELLRQRTTLHAVSVPVILIFTSFFGWLLARRILRPVQAVADTARRITHEDLSARVRIQDIDHEMVHLVEAFNEMILRLDKSFQHITDFSSHVAHELKTPLAIIRGESEILLRKERAPEDYQRVIASNLKEIERLIRIIDDMLVVASLEYDPQALTLAKTSLGELLREAAEQAEILAKAKNVSVRLLLPRNPGFIQCDEAHMRRLLLNLLDNAIKFSPPGRNVTLELRRESGRAEISINDEGPGIPEADRPRIFEKFFHREKPDAERRGHGLGLSIALSVARAHRGDILVKSTPGKGTVFTVVLPLHGEH